jgi:hypothetical protein
MLRLRWLSDLCTLPVHGILLFANSVIRGWWVIFLCMFEFVFYFFVTWHSSAFFVVLWLFFLDQMWGLDGAPPVGGKVLAQKLTGQMRVQCAFFSRIERKRLEY